MKLSQPPRHRRLNKRIHANAISRALLEPLEQRQLLSAIPGFSIEVPILQYQGGFTYTASSQILTVGGAVLGLTGTPPGISLPGQVSINISVDDTGTLIASGASANNLVVTDAGGATLLTGEVTAFGFDPAGSSGGLFQFEFQPTGGTLEPYYATGISVSDNGENSSLFNPFTGSFASDFGGIAKGNVGATPSFGGSPPSITGTKFNDLTGNGFSADDTALAGVTINLYTNGGTTPVASTLTAADGTYSFTNLTPGTYFVQEAVPPGYTQTGGNAGYTIVAISGVYAGNNFDDFQNITITGAKFTDLTGNGFSADDTPLAGVTIDLYQGTSTAGTLLASTTTLANGTYTFANLGPGTYFVQEVLPSGYTQTGGNAGYTVTATSGVNSTGDNFADFQNITITGTKYQDLSGNGLSSDDTPLAGVTIDLFKNGGAAPVATTVTGANGTYSFTNLGPGTYTVQEEVPTGWVETVGNAGYTVTATSGVNSTGDNFADFQNITITGTKYQDLSGNGFSSDDTPLANVTIDLYQGTSTAGTLLASTTTLANGTYAFANLGPGTYFVQEVLPSGYTQTGGNAGYTVTATSGVNSTGDNFADFQNITITGTKYQDLSGNGLSSDDTPLAGVTIDLFKNGGAAPVATTVTGANGTYSFTNLGPGTYTVQEEVPTGWVETVGNAGYTVTATSGLVSTGNNFDDYHTQCTVTGWSYVIDGCKTVSDISGQLHQGDVVKVIFTIAGPTTVSFVSYTAPDSYFNANDASQQKIFDEDVGVYTAAGTYSLTIVVPNCDYQVDFVCGLPIDKLGPAGSNIFYTPQNRLHDSDNGGTTSCIPTIASCNGSGTISGCVFNDKNNDGCKASGDNGIGGVKITCYGTTTSGSCVILYTTTDSNGNYKFCNLPSGTYKIVEHGPDSYIDGKDSAGSCGGTIANDLCTGIVLYSGKTDSGCNFGELQGATLCGTVFGDKDKDGNIDSNECGIAGVKITLTGTNDLGQSVTYVTYTDSNGCYSFTNLRAGKYTLTETEPTGFTTTKNTVGCDGGSVSGDSISSINLTWSADGTGYNFGDYSRSL